MEKHTSKKILAGLLALSAGFVLASCDAITATPTNYNDPIVNNVKSDDKENLMGKIYDAVATDRNTKIVSDLLEEIAEKKFGSYLDYKQAKADPTTYMAAHKDVFYKDSDSKVEGETVESMRLKRWKAFEEDIDERISEFFYNEITSGSYNDDEGRFDEGKLWSAHYYELFDLDKESGDRAKTNKFFVTNEVTKKNAFSLLKGSYDSNSGRGYIEEKVFPQILKDKLVEEYVFNNAYSSLGRSYARNVNYIKVSYEDHVIPWKLLKNYAELHIQNKDALKNFEIITKAVKGFSGVGTFDETVNELHHGVIKLEDGGTQVDTDALALLSATLGALDSVETDEGNVVIIANDIKLGEVTLVEAGSYYKNTKLGEILVSFKKAVKAEEAGRFPTTADKAELDKFLASGKSKEYGLREKLISLAKEDYTTDGWAVKSGGFSELPSELRDRLFNINVANTIDTGELPNETVEDGTMGAYENYGKRLPYMRSIYGNKFVIPAKSQSYADNPYNYIYQDVEGKAFYIVEVLEAPSTPKLNPESETCYTEAFKAEKIAKQVAKVLGTKDSYIVDAYTEYLEKYTFTFYESSLYEHFKGEYPDLFDDED